MRSDELRQLLPDYATGMLSDAERRRVEEALRQFPELRAELEQIRALIETFPPEQLQRELDYRSRSVSVMVNERMRQPAADGTLRWRWVAVAAAAVGVLIVLVYVRGNLTPSLLPHPSVTAVADSDADLEFFDEPLDTLLFDVPSATEQMPQQAVQPVAHEVVESVAEEGLVYGIAPYTDADSQFVEQFIQEMSDALVE